MFKEWHDEIAGRSLRQADAAWVALARVLSWALDRRLIRENPCEKGGRLYSGTRADNVWTAEQEAAFLAVASPQLCLAFMLAIWTGQRQGDLLKLPWSAWDKTPMLPKVPHGRIKLKQSKTGRPVAVAVSTPLRDALDAASRRSPVILLSSEGKPWTAHGFSSSWRKACKKAGVVGVTFHDLRGTFVTRALRNGAKTDEVADVPGQSIEIPRQALSLP